MSSQLEQLLGYLEREGVSQVVIGTGRPITMRTPNGFTNITARPLSPDQVANFLRNPQIDPLIPSIDADSDPTEIQIGKRRAVAVIRRRGNDILLSLTRTDSPVPQPIATQSIARVAVPRTEEAGTAKSATRSKSASNAALGSVPRDFSLDAGIELGSLGDGATPDENAFASRAPADGDIKDAFGSLELDDADPGVAELKVSFGGARSSSASSAAHGSEGARGDLSLDPAVGDFSLELESPGAVHAVAAPSTAPVAFEATRPHMISTTGAAPQVAFGLGEPVSFDRLVRTARERGASDLHISAARVTSIRVGGELLAIDPNSGPLTPVAASDLLLPLLDDALRAQLDKVGYVDLALEAPDGGRLRANISRQQQGLKGTFRLALAAPATLEQLGLPADLAKVVHHHQGLVIVAGPSGHGKTTTLAALVDLLNSSRPFHILTIEDPVEIVHPRKQAVISQRETGRHTTSFARGLKASLREDPDVIVIGELRDRESVEIALTAAETGHLVIATMSTPSAAKTIDRLIDMFPPEEHSQVRASIAGALRAIVAQRLVPKRGGGIVPAVELVTGVLPLAVMIREDKLYQLPNLLQRGRAFGMIRFDESLAELVRAGRVDEEAALAVAESRKDLAAVLRPQQAAAPQAAAKTSQLWGFGKKEQR